MASGYLMELSLWHFLINYEEIAYKIFLKPERKSVIQYRYELSLHHSPHIYFPLVLGWRIFPGFFISKVHNKHFPLLKAKIFILYKTTSFAMHMSSSPGLTFSLWRTCNCNLLISHFSSTEGIARIPTFLPKSSCLQALALLECWTP